MRLQEYIHFDAVDLAALVRRREVSPAELVACAIEQITRINPKLNAVVDTWFDRANDQVAKGLPEGPFSGVPLLLKDDLDLAGTPMTLGSAFLKGRLCDYTHPIAERLLAAGFVVLGRTNMSEVGLLPVTEPRLYGPTSNPWGLDYSPGGSSGGSAVAVAARMVPIASASDGGGSSRIPASACGLVGLKPSRGRHSTMLADDPHGFIVRSALVRTVRDCAAVLDLIAGASAWNRWQLLPPGCSYGAMVERAPEPLRIGFMLGDCAGNVVHADCRAAVEHSAHLCEQLGHRVEETRLDLDGSAFNEAFLVLWAMAAGYYWQRIRASIGEHLRPWQRPGLRNQAVFDAVTRLAQSGSALHSPFEPFTRRLAAIDAKQSPSDLWFAWSTMGQADVAFSRLFQDYDLLLCPVLGQPPWKTGYFHHDWSDQEMRAHLFPYLGITHMANTTGLPAISLPLYWNAEGLPIGTQVFAPWGREDLLLSLAAALERESPWSNRCPEIAAAES